MPRLGDVIGSLLSDLARARVRADVETVRLAEAYARHDLLRHLPAPRFRLPEISVDLPVVINRVEATGASSEPIARLFDPPARSELTKIVRRALAEASLDVPWQRRRQLYDAVHRKTEATFRDVPGASSSSGRITRNISELVSQRLAMSQRGAADTEKIAKVAARVKDLLGELLLRKVLDAPYLDVLVGSSEIRERAQEGAATRINLRISEDSMEILSDQDDPAPTRLVPE